MATKLDGKKVAILATDGFEQSELLEPRKALDEAGATTQVVSIKAGQIQGMKQHQPDQKVKVDLELKSAKASDYDALLLPGGVANPDSLRMDESAVAFVRHFVESGKPIAAICHGPWTLINANGVRGVNMTSWPSLRIDLQNGGANWIDSEVVTDQGIVTSRKPDDIPAFNRKMLEEFAEGVHRQRAQKHASAGKHKRRARRPTPARHDRHGCHPEERSDEGSRCQLANARRSIRRFFVASPALHDRPRPEAPSNENYAPCSSCGVATGFDSALPRWRR